MDEQQINQAAEQQNGAMNHSKTGEWYRKVFAVFFGDVLVAGFLRRQVKLLVLIVMLTFFYIGNRYSCELELIKISKLKEKLTEIKYGALTRSSELMEKSRQSRIEEYISERESDLQTSTTPPYVIKK